MAGRSGGEAPPSRWQLLLATAHADYALLAWLHVKQPSCRRLVAHLGDCSVSGQAVGAVLEGQVGGARRDGNH